MTSCQLKFFPFCNIQIFLSLENNHVDMNVFSSSSRLAILLLFCVWTVPYWSARFAFMTHYLSIEYLRLFFRCFLMNIFVRVEMKQNKNLLSNRTCATETFQDVLSWRLSSGEDQRRAFFDRYHSRLNFNSLPFKQVELQGKISRSVFLFHSDWKRKWGSTISHHSIGKRERLQFLLWYDETINFHLEKQNWSILNISSWMKWKNWFIHFG